MRAVNPATGDPFEKSFTEPSMERFVEARQIDDEETTPTTLVSNGTVDIRGRIADKRKTGGWKASSFIIVNEVAERLAFFSIGVSLVAYLVIEMRQSLPTAATHVTDWIGAAYVLTILGAFVADAYLGRFMTVIVFSAFYAVGMVLLTLSAGIDSLHPGPCTAKPCAKATDGQNGLLFVALALIALGTGGIKPCVSSFGADQFDVADEKEKSKKYSFFNWFFFAINMGALLGITVFVYVREKKGWIWGFGVPTGTMIFSVIILAAGARHYRFQKPMGSPFTRFVQVTVAAIRNHARGVRVARVSELYEVSTRESDITGAQKLSHTDQYRFLDKAAVLTDPEADTKNRWRLCTVTQVEEFKCIVRVLPIWLFTIALPISFAQFSTFFISQAATMDRKLGPHFEIPSGSVAVFSSSTTAALVPFYEKLVVPILRKHTGHPRGITSLQRMGVGLFISILGMACAAVVEQKRRQSLDSLNMSVFWLFPQFCLIGSAEVFTYVGQLEFFYDEATEGTRSISSSMFLTEFGIGSWLSTAIVKIIEGVTGGEDKGWFRSTLNESKLDYFYWVLGAINAINFVIYLWVSRRYKGRGCADRAVRDEALIEVATGKESQNQSVVS